MVGGVAARLAVAGLVIGAGCSAALATLLRSLLVGMGAVDPVSYAGVALLFALVLGLACWGPTTRAASTDPAVALRAESPLTGRSLRRRRRGRQGFGGSAV